ncbi:MAG: Crp/Fnr family transcriptional regulator [Desulfurobacteriaceae bacterium]
MGDLVAFFRQVQLLSGLSEKQLEDIERVSFLKKYPKGTIIFDPSKRAKGFYVLKKGKVKIYRSNKGKEQIIRVFSQPTFFGEAASFIGEKFPAWAESLKDSEILFIPREEFLELIKNDPEISMKLLAVMSQRLIYLTGIIENLALKDALSKVSAYILKNCKESNSESFRFSTNLAAMELGLTKETVSRTLSKLKSMGIIEKNGNLIKVKNLNDLLELSK